MIKIFSNSNIKELEKMVNEYIEICGSKIFSIQYQATETDVSVCIVHDLDFINNYK